MANSPDLRLVICEAFAVFFFTLIPFIILEINSVVSFGSWRRWDLSTHSVSGIGRSEGEKKEWRIIPVLRTF